MYVLRYVCNTVIELYVILFTLKCSAVEEPFCDSRLTANQSPVTLTLNDEIYMRYRV